MPRTIEQSLSIKSLADDIGVDNTAERLGITRESVRRSIRVARKEIRRDPVAPGDLLD
mgnify:CR=1 FL=1